MEQHSIARYLPLTGFVISMVCHPFRNSTFVSTTGFEEERSGGHVGCCALLYSQCLACQVPAYPDRILLGLLLDQ